MNSDDELLDRLSVTLSAPVPDASPDRIAAVRAEASRRQEAAARPSAQASGVTSRRALLLSAAAAAIGAAGSAAIVKSTEDEPTAAPAPPTEAITFSPSASAVAGSVLGINVSGKVINHTWGVELLLDANGFPVGGKYRVVYIDSAESTVEAGGFVGAELPIHCRCNAPLLREGITAIEIRDSDDALVSRANFA